MKLKPTSDPEPVFNDRKRQPTAAEMQKALGAAAPAIAEVLTRINELAPEMTMAWKYYTRSGWYQVYSLKERRLLYVGPKREGVRVSLLLGDKAIVALRAGPFGARVTKLLSKAKRFPEGTGFVFERGRFDPKLVAAMVAAKLAKN
jgi:hypothetical protein